VTAAWLSSKRGAVVAALALIALLAAMLLVSPATMARGWLVAFAICSGFCVGSLLLLLIHRLTGGAWGQALAPVFMPVALLLPAVAMAFVPIALALPAIYPWANDAAPVAPSVARAYLNAPFFLLRAAVALIGWAVLGLVFGRARGGRLLAALGLIFFAAAISSVATDWFLSIEPGYVSSAFPAMIAIQQLLTAVAVAALLAPAPLPQDSTRQIGGLLIATLLGVLYLELMTFIVDWYGDLPPKAAWYLARGSGGWRIAIVAALAFAGAAFALLLVENVRRSQTGVRFAAALAIVAVCIHTAWIVIPAFSDPAGVLVAACISLGALAVLTRIGVASLTPSRRADHVPGPPVQRFSSTPIQGRLLWAGAHAVLAAFAATIGNRRAEEARTSAAGRHVAAPVPDHAPPENPAVAAAPVLAFTFGFLVLVAASGAGLYFYLGTHVSGALVAPPRAFPQPQLEFEAAQERVRLEAEQRQRLSTYEWIDRDRGLVRIPIERAFEAIVARGARAFDPLDEAPPAPDPSQSGSGPP
jgi:hypothetical protein